MRCKVSAAGPLLWADRPQAPEAGGSEGSMTLSGDMAYMSAASSPRSSVSMRWPPMVR